MILTSRLIHLNPLQASPLNILLHPPGLYLDGCARARVWEPETEEKRRDRVRVARRRCGTSQEGASRGRGTGRRRERQEEALERRRRPGEGRRSFAWAERSFFRRAVSVRCGLVGSARLPRCPREGGRPRRVPRPSLLTAAAGLELSALGSAASAPSGSLPSAPTPPAPVRIVSQLLASRPMPGCFLFPGPSSWVLWPLHLGRGACKGAAERPEKKEARPGGGRSADCREETPRHPFWSSPLPPRPYAHSLAGELLSDGKVRAALGDSAAGLVPGKPRVCSRLVRRTPSQGDSPDRGWLQLQPAPGSRTSISFSRSLESKRLYPAPASPLSSRGRVVLPPTHRLPRGAREFGRLEERGQGPWCVSLEEGVDLVRGGGKEGERPSIPAMAHSDHL